MANNKQPLNEIVQFYNSIPIVTRTLLTLTVVISLSCHLGFIQYGSVTLDWYTISKRFQLWRLVSPLFIHGVNIPFLFMLYFMYQESKELETNVFLNKPADYAYFIILTSISSLVLSFTMGYKILGDCLYFSIMYLWSRRFSSSIVSCYCVFTFKALYLPWILVLLRAIISASIPYTALIGIASAFAYDTLCGYLIKAGPRVLSAPSFLRNILPDPKNNFQSGRGYAATAPRGKNLASESQQEHKWGKGHRLG